MIQHKYRRMSYWWPLVKSLVAFLNAQKSEDEVDENGNPLPLFDGVAIYAGSRGKGKDFPCIEIGYESEGDISAPVPNVGQAVITIDVCVEGSDEDPSVAYELQDELQGKILSRLPDWPRIARDEAGIAPNVTIDGIASDGDIYRPVAYSRIFLNVEWRKPL